MSKFRLNSKNLFLTYPKSTASKQGLGDHLLHLLEPDYIRVCQETHQDGSKHFHVLVQRSKKYDIRNAKMLDWNGEHGNYVSARGSYEQVCKYMGKEDNDPFEFGIANISMGDRSAETKRGVKERNELLVKSDLTSLVSSSDLSVERYIQVKKNVDQFKMDLKVIGHYMQRTCIWLYGSPGSGKSRWCRAKYPGFFSKPQNKWWDGYRGQSAVVLDDYDTPALSHYLKIWSDVYSFWGEIKGGTVACDYSVFVITSNYWPADIWKEPTDEVLVQAINRRFQPIRIEDALLTLDADLGGNINP